MQYLDRLEEQWLEKPCTLVSENSVPATEYSQYNQSNSLDPPTSAQSQINAAEFSLRGLPAYS